VEYKYISADSHLNTRWFPKNTWLARMPARFRDRAPIVVETDNGTIWQCDGKRVGEAADGRDNPKYLDLYRARGVEVEDNSLPGADPKTILRHMDQDGVYAAAFYGDTRKWNVADTELWLEINRVYNDHYLEIASCAPERLLALPNLPARVPELCADELLRVVTKGAKGVELSVFDAATRINDDVWEPLWSAAEEADVPICCHIGDKFGTPYPPNHRGSLLAHYSTVPFSIGAAISTFIFSGILERHPKLRVCFAECRIGWVPFLVSWMDRQVRERQPDPTAPLSLLPSEYFKRQVRLTFEDDMLGAKLIPMPWGYLADSVMWGADYPHPQGVWPNPDPTIAEMFDGVDPALRQAAVCDRAAEFFRIKVPLAVAA
jgi:uncharacterized protein